MRLSGEAGEEGRVAGCQGAGESGIQNLQRGDGETKVACKR